ncbi:MAG: penicillin-binding protein 2 [Desulfobacteraceae bacterium]|nr:penicillin-binding protein 2 [Desulfobacteraceae bacterium]
MKRKNPHVVRIVVVSIFFLLWFGAVGVRAGYLQIVKGAWLSKKAADQSEQELILRGKRGTIYDSRQEALAVSIETTSITANPRVMTDKNKAASQLAKAVGVPVSYIKTHLNTKRAFVWIKRQATPNEVAAVKKLAIKGIDFVPEYSRFYPGKTLCSQVMGFAGIDGHGLEGVEFYYDKDLQGSENTITVFKDALGRNLDADRLAGLNQAGNSLLLTIDGQVQYIAEQALAEAVIDHKARSGMALVMVPQTGALLAVANYPFFNPNAQNKHDQDDWRNRAVTDPFEPGSTMKIFSAAAGLESGKLDSNTIFYCENGIYMVGGHTVHDTKPYGWLSLQQVVKYSSNIGAVKLAQQIGPHVLYDHLNRFGFGLRTGVDSPGESPGSLANFKRWTSVDTGAIAFGQGVSVTALQLITATAALANDGLMMRPYVVQSVLDPNGKLLRAVAPQIVGQVVAPDTAKTVRQIMRSVVTEGGTGVKAEVDGYSACGKTGTAQKIEPDGSYSRHRYVASFVGFAPFERPAIAVLVVVDEPQNIYYGGLVAAPAFSRIVRETLGYMNVMPSEEWQRLRVARETGVNG